MTLCWLLDRHIASIECIKTAMHNIYVTIYYPLQHAAAIKNEDLDSIVDFTV